MLIREGLDGAYLLSMVTFCNTQSPDVRINPSFASIVPVTMSDCRTNHCAICYPGLKGKEESSNIPLAVNVLMFWSLIEFVASTSKTTKEILVKS